MTYVLYTTLDRALSEGAIAPTTRDAMTDMKPEQSAALKNDLKSAVIQTNDQGPRTNARADTLPSLVICPSSLGELVGCPVAGTKQESNHEPTPSLSNQHPYIAVVSLLLAFVSIDSAPFTGACALASGVVRFTLDQRAA
jgi:hypothetical protein